MNVAREFSRRATCSLASVGVVISREGRILSTGYNGAPAGMPHCHHELDWEESPTCDVSVHAEANAIAYAARWGMSLQDAEMHSTHWGCINCSKLIVSCGIIRVVAENPYRDFKGVALLKAAGIDLLQWI